MIDKYSIIYVKILITTKMLRDMNNYYQKNEYKNNIIFLLIADNSYVS